MAERVDIVTFLTARLAEDEATAVWATGAVASTKPPSLLPGALAQWEAGPREVLRVGVPYGEQGYKVAGLSQQDIADHIARHDPARVLREVAAKRKLLEWCARAAASDWSAWNHDRPVPDQIQNLATNTAIDMSLRAMAAPYDGHPDFNPRWRME